MPRNTSTRATATLEGDIVLDHSQTLPVGHPKMPEGGNVQVIKYDDGETVQFTKKNGGNESRRTSQNWEF